MKFSLKSTRKRPRLSITHPFVVLERSCEAHGLDELGEGSYLLIRVLGRLLHVTKLQDHKQRRTINTQKKQKVGEEEKKMCLFLARIPQDDPRTTEKNLELPETSNQHEEHHAPLW